MKEKLKKLIAYYKPYKLLFYSDLFFAVLGAGVTLVIPLIVRYITNQVVYYEPPEARQAILMLGAVMIALVLLEFGCNYYIAYFGHMMGARMEDDMRSHIFGHYQKLTFAFYDNQKVGHLLSRITGDLFDISELLHHGPEDVLISIIKIAGSFIILVNINARLTIVAFAFVPAMLLFAVYYNNRVVKSFANEKEEMKKFNRGNNNFVEAKKTSYRYMGMYHSGLNALTTLVTVGVLVAGGSYLTAGSVNVSDLITFLLYINNFTEPVKKLVNSAEQFQNGYTGFERFLEILSIAPDIADKEDAVHVEKLKGEITFCDVSFHYEDNDEKVLNHISLKVELDVVRAAKNANAHAFIMSFPEGYDTDIGQRGVKLSGGQKQRLSIARVFLKNLPILIFDEATSALDNESEQMVQQSLEGLAKDRTTFVIAHRLTTIQNAQRILVLTEEGIAEQGTHEELLAEKGTYEALCYGGRHRMRHAGC